MKTTHPPSAVVAFLLLLAASTHTLYSRPEVRKIEPPNWWTGMQWRRVELMVYGRDLDGVAAAAGRQGVTVRRTRPGTNPSYAFIQIEIAEGAKSGSYPLFLVKGADTLRVEYPILERPADNEAHRGVDPADVVYLITPDRFADGDTANNLIPGMLDGFHPDSLIGRHGGDIRGIIGKLDYLRDLGVTALWINPLVENNAQISYHGYAATDVYRIDPRFGSNELYRELVRESHRRGLKVIMDHVSNHVSINHPWISNLPSPSWLNGTVQKHQVNRHRKTLLPDIHSDSAAKSNTLTGWFTDDMPDLNQRDPEVSAYLIQNTLWWIEYAGIDGIREDTYSYADPGYLAAWAEAVLADYPALTMIGEVWLNDPVYIAPYQSGSCCAASLDTHLASVTDYGLFTAFMRVFGDERAPIDCLQECLTKDFLYGNPSKLLIFLDNHDVTRIMSICRGDTARFTLALTLLLTLRGIPEILYGTEIGMAGERDHGVIRANFPGGFRGDTRNAFTPDGRTPEENAIFRFCRKLISIRKEHRALGSGALVHFPPAGNVYVYFRILDTQKIMIVANNAGTPQQIRCSDYGEYLGGAARLRDLMTGSLTPLEPGTRVSVEANTAKIFEVMDR
jgi:glycosidase